MPASLLAMWLLAGAVLAAEAWVVRRSARWCSLSVVRTVPMVASRARRALEAWLRRPANPLAIQLLAGDGEELSFHWDRGRGRGRARVEAAGEDRSRLAVELELDTLGRRRRALAIGLLIVVGLPLAVGVPLLVRFEVHRTGDPSHHFMLIYLLNLYWPLHPLVGVRAVVRRSRAITEAVVLGLPVRDAAS